MLRYLMTGGNDPKQYVIHLLLCIPIILLSLSLHETMHGYVAYKLGDPTAKNLGRLTLNPLKHLDPLGFLCMLLMGFGWANPVPINTRYFKNPRRDMAISAIAGPLSNLSLAVIFTALLKVFYLIIPHVAPMIQSDVAYNILEYTQIFMLYGISLNVSLAVFNLLPVPPLDGSRFFYVFLPPKYYFGVMKYERYISLAVMLLLFVGALDPILSLARNGIMRLLIKIFAIYK